MFYKVKSNKETSKNQFCSIFNFSFKTLIAADEIHNDLKPGNYLVKFQNGPTDLKNLTIVLTDFGLIGDDTKGGTPMFASPQCFEENRDLMSDLFSLGRVFLYMSLSKARFLRKALNSSYFL